MRGGVVALLFAGDEDEDEDAELTFKSLFTPPLPLS